MIKKVKKIFQNIYKWVESYLERYKRYKGNALDKNPLVPRTINNSLIGLSYNDYLSKRTHNSIISLINCNIGIDPLEEEFDNKLHYLIETVEDLHKKKEEVKELWELSFQLLKNRNSPLIQFIEINYTVLVSITGEANLEVVEREKVYSKFEHEVSEIIKTIINLEIDFTLKIKTINDWYNFHFKFLNYLGLGINYNELHFINSLVNSKYSNFEKLKSNSPETFINFVNTIKQIFNRYESFYRPMFRDLYIDKCFEQILVAKNSGYWKNYKKYIGDYYSEKYIEKPCLNWLFKNLTGYGEEPWRLVIMFLLVNLVFTILFTLTNLEFHFEIEPSNIGERIVYFLSFNTTTMMTVGYGDIYPQGIGARLMVILLQIIGFTISASAVTLYLKKIFRF